MANPNESGIKSNRKALTIVKAKRTSVGIQRERCIWEKGGKDSPYKKHDGSPARPARHEPPIGKQGEDEHEQNQSEEVQKFVRHPPGRGTRRHRACRNDRAKRHKHERDQQRHAVIGSALGDHCADHQTHHHRGKRERDRVRGVVAERQAYPFEHTCLLRSQ